MEHVCRVAVPHRVYLDMPCDLRPDNGPPAGSGERAFVHVVSGHDIAVGIHRQVVGRGRSAPDWPIVEDMTVRECLFEFFPILLDGFGSNLHLQFRMNSEIPQLR